MDDRGILVRRRQRGRMLPRDSSLLNSTEVRAGHRPGTALVAAEAVDTAAPTTMSAVLRQMAPSRKASSLGFWLFSLAFVFFNTVFVPTSLPSVPVLGGVNLYPTDLLLGALLILGAMYRFSNSPVAVRSPLSKYMVIFLAVLCFEAAYAIAVLHRPPLPVLVKCRTYAGYALFFPMLWALGTVGGVQRIIRLWAVLASAGALLYIFQVFHGEPSIFHQHAWLYSRQIAATIGGGAGDAQHLRRLFSQGTVLFRIMLFVAFIIWLLSASRASKWWLMVAALIAIQVLLQFTRGMYITSLAILLIMPTFIKEPVPRRRLFYVTVAAGVGLGMVILFKVASGSHSHLLAFIWDRFSRVFTHAGSDTSIQQRIEGAQALLGDLSGHWLFGLGLGNGIDYGDSTYISLLVDTGILGTFAFLLLFSVACVRGLRNIRHMPTTYERALLLALTLSTCRYLVNGLSQSDFAVNVRIPALAISIALMEILIVRARTTVRQTPSDEPLGAPQRAASGGVLRRKAASANASEKTYV